MFTSAQKRLWSSRPKHGFPWVRLGLLLVGMLVLTACSAPAQSIEGPSIALADLPPTLGRGFGEVVIEHQGERVAALSPGHAAPNFGLRLDDGSILTLADLQGRPVMISFWATWCGPCRLEMPDIVAASEADGDLVVLAVNVQENLDVIQPFVAEFGMSMPVARDVNGDLQELYGLRGLPTSIFIRADGTVASIWAGMLTKETLASMLAEIDRT